MCESHLERANRELLDAIRTPPDTGLESRLDHVAATLWTLREADAATADVGKLRRLDRKLAGLEAKAAPERTAHVARARESIQRYLESVTPPT